MAFGTPRIGIGGKPLLGPDGKPFGCEGDCCDGGGFNPFPSCADLIDAFTAGTAQVTVDVLLSGFTGGCSGGARDCSGLTGSFSISPYSTYTPNIPVVGSHFLAWQIDLGDACSLHSSVKSLRAELQCFDGDVYLGAVVGVSGGPTTEWFAEWGGGPIALGDFMGGVDYPVTGGIVTGSGASRVCYPTASSNGTVRFDLL